MAMSLDVLIKRGRATALPPNHRDSPFPPHPHHILATAVDLERRCDRSPVVALMPPEAESMFAGRQLNLEAWIEQQLAVTDQHVNGAVFVGLELHGRRLCSALAYRRSRRRR